MKRRYFLGAGAAFAGLALVFRGRVAHAANRLRPPGAKPGDAFEKACIRCFRCAEVCPTKCIKFDSLLAPRVADTPFIDARESPCILCMKCTEACPTDALQKIAATPAAISQAVRMGVPKLDRSKCLPWNGKGVCRLCFYVCPYQDKAVALVGPQQAPFFEARDCVGCGQCEEACPESAKAITIVPPGSAT